ncbi:MAG TPA: hypothetical protein VGY32_09720 [Solirubrobacteraceae bacterium]|jgi:hypothetical protein|nr:hypothetical protein [Solirubrobacteraceae bacterium]
MVGAQCRPIPTATENGQSPDRFLELLDCLADLRVEATKQRVEICQARGLDDPRVGELVGRLAELELELGRLSVDAAAAHQLAQHIHLI